MLIGVQDAEKVKTALHKTVRISKCTDLMLILRDFTGDETAIFRICKHPAPAPAPPLFMQVASVIAMELQKRHEIH